MFKCLLVLLAMTLASCSSQVAFMCEVSMGDLGVRECGFDTAICLEKGCISQGAAWCFTQPTSVERKMFCAASLRECESFRNSKPNASPICWRASLQEVKDFM